MRSIAYLLVPLLLPTLVMGLTVGCMANPLPAGQLPIATQPTNAPSTREILQQSWIAYRQRFIQGDGRVIDWESNARTVSEGQAYAMLRAVFVDDPETFELTLRWAENNLQRRNGDTPTDSLWAWKWGQQQDGNWGILDANFASDADLDAATALILAARRWNRPDYLELARTKLRDLWNLSTLEIPAQTRRSQPRSQPVRYFLPGPVSAFQPKPDQIYLNPSYLAPYAFRLFAQVDPERNWLSLVDSSYQILEDSADLSPVGLPSDWVAFNPNTREFSRVPVTSRLRSGYGFDAYRVWWRVALDAAWFAEPRAEAFLRQHLTHLQELWQRQQFIPARISLRGRALARYEATSQYAMLYPAFQLIDPVVAEEIRQQKLLPTYKNGIWDNDSAYYVQNLAWFGLFPATEIAANWLQP
ncbi:MAG: glycosyl hydrolase [Synechococcales cyanobacterium M58_A2018_015]|nr:glycosyl hydrolase [Synechococcales cyanobacterium M58_A2018_015]